LKTQKKNHILCHFEKIITQVAKFSQEKKKKKKKKKTTSAGFNIRLEFHQMKHFPV
jgi:hypothetical protein